MESSESTEAGRGKARNLIGQLAGLLGIEIDKEGTGVRFRPLLRQLKAVGMTNCEIGEALECGDLAVSKAERGEIMNPPAEQLEALVALIEKRLSENQTGRSDEERRMLLSQGLESAFGGTGKIVWIDAVFSEQKQVVFGVVVDNVTGRKEQLFSSTFTLAEDSGGEITFSEPVEVERRVSFEPVESTNKSEKEEGAMKRDEVITTLVAAGPLSKDELDKLSDDQLEALNQREEAAAEVAVAAKKKEEEAAAATNKDGKGEEERVAGSIKPATDGEGSGSDEEKATAANKKEQEEQAAKIVALESTVEELKTATQPAVDERERERQSLVAELAVNERVPFDKAELEAKPVEELRKLNAMSRGESYAARGGPQIATQSTEGPQYAEPVAYFDQEEDAGKEGKDK